MNFRRYIPVPTSLSTSYARGLIAECYAGCFLFFKGYRIVAWRYKTPVGEIDFIIQRNGITAFVEVKLRPDKDSGLHAVTPQMRSRIARAASYFMSAQKLTGETSRQMRFDVVAVSGFRIWHLDNAWFPAP